MSCFLPLAPAPQRNSVMSSLASALHLPDPISVDVDSPDATPLVHAQTANAVGHDLVQPIRQLLSSVATNHPTAGVGGSRSLEEELSQLEASDENFHRCLNDTYSRERERGEHCVVSVQVCDDYFTVLIATIWFVSFSIVYTDPSVVSSRQSWRRECWKEMDTAQWPRSQMILSTQRSEGGGTRVD